MQKFNETLGRCVPRIDELQETIRIYDESENCGIMIPDCNKDGNILCNVAKCFGVIQLSI